MYILLPYAVFVLTLTIIILVAGLYYEYKEYRSIKAKSQPLPSFTEYIFFAKNNKSISEDGKFWWQDPYLYIGIILFIVIGAIAYLIGLLTIVGTSYLFMLLNL